MRLVDAVFARIKELMKEKGMSMYRLAMNGGVPRSTIATIPLSETVTLATIYGVCEGFQITLQEFFDSPLFDKERIKSLETEQTREETEYDTDGLGFDVVENKEIARLQIIYPGGGRVDNETYKRLRENGFVFSRTNGAFQRQLNENSRYAVRRFIQSQRNVVEQITTRKETEAEM